MSRETIITNDGLVLAAKLVKNNADMWVVLGKQTAWTDEASPDEPAATTHSITEPLVAIKAQTKSLAREVSEDDYNDLSANARAMAYSSTGYVYLELVSDDEAYEKAATQIYIEVVYAPLIGMPEGDFRAFGVCSGLVPADGYENAEWLAPINVKDGDYGLLVNLSHGIVYTQTDSGRAVRIPILVEYEF